MKIVSSTGHGFTGSTAITDLLSEYSCIQSCSVPSYELKFFHDPQGILYLYNNIVQSKIPSAKNVAVNQFYDKCVGWANEGTKMNYEKFFHGHFLEATDRYLTKMGGDKFCYVYDYSHMNRIQRFATRLINKKNAIISSMFVTKKYGENHVKPSVRYAEKRRAYMYYIDREQFCKLTKEYFNELFGQIADKEYFNIHELIPNHMIDECSLFFDDLYIIRTDRDPRDVYLNAKYKAETVDFPVYDVKVFCNYYRYTRELLKEALKKEQKKEVLFVQFEDLVYKYEETVARIERFLDIASETHVRAKTRFIPELSVKNCNLKQEYAEVERDNIQYIERELKEWIYDFDSIL